MADVRLTQLFTNIANAIRNKKGSDGIIKAADFPAEIESIEVGGGEVVEVERKDVNFYDYEGTLLFSYTLAEVQAAGGEREMEISVQPCSIEVADVQASIDDDGIRGDGTPAPGQVRRNAITGDRTIY